MDDKYCTLSTGAELLDVSRPTLYKLIKDGEIEKHVFFGRPALKLIEVNRLKAKRGTAAKQNGKKARK